MSSVPSCAEVSLAPAGDVQLGLGLRRDKSVASRKEQELTRCPLQSTRPNSGRGSLSSKSRFTLAALPSSAQSTTTTRLSLWCVGEQPDEQRKEADFVA